MASASPELPLFETLSALLDAVPSHAVLITAPAESHAALVEVALERGLHVLVEKPLAPDSAAACRIARLASRSNRLVWVGFNRRFWQPYQRLRQRRQAHPGSLPGVVLSELRSGAAGLAGLGGGPGELQRRDDVLDEIAPHQLDLLPWLLGRTVESVSARTEPPDQRGSCAVSFDLFSGGGLMARCRASHSAMYREWVIADVNNHRLLADRLGLVESQLPIRLLRWAAAPRAVGAALLSRFRRNNEVSASFRRQLDSFAAAIQGDPIETRGADADEAARVSLLIEACRQSSALGGARVDISTVSQGSG